MTNKQAKTEKQPKLRCCYNCKNVIEKGQNSFDKRGYCLCGLFFCGDDCVEPTDVCEKFELVGVK